MYIKVICIRMYSHLNEAHGYTHIYIGSKCLYIYTLNLNLPGLVVARKRARKIKLWFISRYSYKMTVTYKN